MKQCFVCSLLTVIKQKVNTCSPWTLCFYYYWKSVIWFCVNVIDFGIISHKLLNICWFEKKSEFELNLNLDNYFVLVSSFSWTILVHRHLLLSNTLWNYQRNFFFKSSHLIRLSLIFFNFTTEKRIFLLRLFQIHLQTFILSN